MKTKQWIQKALLISCCLVVQLSRVVTAYPSETKADKDEESADSRSIPVPTFLPDQLVGGEADGYTLNPLLKTPVQKPLNLTITQVTDKQIELSWRQDKVGSAQDYEILVIRDWEKIDGSSKSTTVLKVVKADEEQIVHRLQDLESSTQYRISVSNAKATDPDYRSNEIIVITAPNGHASPLSPPKINIENSCVDRNNLQIVWKTQDRQSNFFYYAEYRNVLARGGLAEVWNQSTVETEMGSRSNVSTRLTISNYDRSASYEVRISAGFAYDKATMVLAGKSLVTPVGSNTVRLLDAPNCIINRTALAPSALSTTSIPPTIETSSESATVGFNLPSHNNNLQTTTTLSTLTVPYEGTNFTSNGNSNIGGEGVLKIGIGTNTPSTSPNDDNHSSSGRAPPPEDAMSSSSTMIFVSVAISVVVLAVLIILLLWRNNKYCRGRGLGFCYFGSNYYIIDPPRLPLLGSHNNGNIGWDGDGTSMKCGAGVGGGGAGGLVGTKNNSNSSTNITMTSSSVDEQQQQQQQLKESIPIHLFPKHVTELHTDGDIGFSKEYEIIQNASLHNDQNNQFTSEFSHHPENKLKNRYLNIVAYDHTLVRVDTENHSSGGGGCGLGSMSNGLTGGGNSKKWTTGYINGNYIDGFQKPFAYIGTQGPLPSTFETFWNVVWEHNVTTIVMITNLIERGRKKCDMYWPKEIGTSETYGLVQVKLVKEQEMATYTLRTFLVQHQRVKKKKKTGSKKFGKFGSSYNNSIGGGGGGGICGGGGGAGNGNDTERIVYHYHYTNWPDHGTPSHTLPVLSFVKKSSQSNAATNGGPIIVHCSAGVGRTGTYIVLDAMLKQISARGDVNVFGFLRHIRSQRNFLVQTEEQYIFIHDALLEAIQSDNTNVEQSSIAPYMNTLLSTTSMDETGLVTTLLDHHFKLITEFQPKDFQTSSSHKACNVSKIRNPDYICTDGYRVPLTPKAGIEGSDFINASFLLGYGKLTEFILTQHPLESTITSFWQMLSDQNVQTVVVLSAVDDHEFPIFWPTTELEDLELDTFRVKLLEESDRVGYVLRDLSIQSLADDDELNVKMIQSSHWPHHCASIQQSIFQLVDVVMETVRETPCSASPQGLGPVVIVDRFGGREGATFCVLTTVVNQMEFESTVDVYMYAKLYHEQRPGIWKTPEDYLYMYRCLAELTSGLKNEDNNDDVTTSGSSSTSSTSTSTGSPPSPATEPVISTSVTPAHGLAKKEEGPARDVVVVVQINNEAKSTPETEQMLLPTIITPTSTTPQSPVSSVSSNSSVVLCVSPYKQGSPTQVTCEHLMKPLQPISVNSVQNSASTPSPVQAQAQHCEFQKDFTLASPIPLVKPITSPSPVSTPVAAIAQMITPTPSPTKNQNNILLELKESSSSPLHVPKTAKSSGSPSPQGLEKKVSLAALTPSPTKSQKEGLHPTTVPNPAPTTPSPTKSPSPVKYQEEQLVSVSTPSPPPPPLPSSPPPGSSSATTTCTLDEGQSWDDVVVVMQNEDDSSITPPPPQLQELSPSPIHSATSSTPPPAPQADITDNDDNLPSPPPPTTEEHNGIPSPNDCPTIKKVAMENGGKEDGGHNGDVLSGMRTILLAEIKEEDESSTCSKSQDSVG